MRISDWSSDVGSSDLEVPNNPVDMSSWGLSACYPRRTFYPLSDGPSTRDHRITMTDFRLCSARRPRSQAGLCHCTQQLISDQLEPTFARLRYSLGGDRPSQTTHHAGRSEEHTSELQSLMRISYAVFCLKKKKN